MQNSGVEREVNTLNKKTNKPPHAVCYTTEKLTSRAEDDEA